jgi:osmotically-inducible protein OsmY
MTIRKFFYASVAAAAFFAAAPARADNYNHYGTDRLVPKPAERTAFDQSNKPESLNATREIRQRILNDASLSGLAQNVAVITTDDGKVTLRGAVISAAEKKKIVEIARSVVPAGNVNDQMNINPKE